MTDGENFLFNAAKNLNVSDMSVQCKYFELMRFSAERIVGSTGQSQKFSNFGQEVRFSLPSHSDPPFFLLLLLTGLKTRDSRSRKNIRKYISYTSMEAVPGKWMNRGSNSSSFNRIITLRGQIYHYINAFNACCLAQTCVSTCVYLRQQLLWSDTTAN